MKTDFLCADKMTQTSKNNTMIESYTAYSSKNFPDNAQSFFICPSEYETMAMFRSSLNVMKSGHCCDSHDLNSQEYPSSALNLISLQNDVSRQESYSRLLERGNVETFLTSDTSNVDLMECFSTSTECESFIPETCDVSLYESLPLWRSKSSHNSNSHPEAPAKVDVAHNSQEHGVPPLLSAQVSEKSSNTFSSDTFILGKKNLKRMNENNVAYVMTNSTSSTLVETLQTPNLKTPLLIGSMNSKKSKCKSLSNSNEKKKYDLSRISPRSWLSQNTKKLGETSYNEEKIDFFTKETDDVKNSLASCIKIYGHEPKEIVGNKNQNQLEFLKSGKNFSKSQRNVTKKPSGATLQEKKIIPSRPNSNSAVSPNLSPESKFVTNDSSEYNKNKNGHTSISFWNRLHNQSNTHTELLPRQTIDKTIIYDKKYDKAFVESRSFKKQVQAPAIVQDDSVIFEQDSKHRIENTENNESSKVTQVAISNEKIEQVMSKDSNILHVVQNKMTSVKDEKVLKNNCMSHKRSKIRKKRTLENEEPIKRGRGRPKRNPGEGWPKRPLSAYNLFFKCEREKILKSLKPLNDKSQVQEKRKRIRKNRAPKHGKISFSDLAKTIGARWKTLHQEEKTKFEMQAIKNMKDYRYEVAQFHEKRKMNR